MAGLIATISSAVITKEVLANYTTCLRLLEQYGTFRPDIFTTFNYKVLSGGYSAYRIAKGGTFWAIKASAPQSFYNDYYFRLQTKPVSLNLGILASTQTRQIYLWNAYPNQNAVLTSITVLGTAGISVGGVTLPYTMTPTQEATINVIATTTGPANVNTTIQFNFTSLPSPPIISVTGSRALQFDDSSVDNTPEVPVIEKWNFLSDVLISIDGTEQRSSVSGEMPLIENEFKIILDSEAKQNFFYTQLLTAFGRFWLPEYQYATIITQTTLSGSSTLYYDNTKTDIRVGEYVEIKNATTATLVQILTIETYGATLTSPLTFDATLNSLIIPGSAAIVDNNTAIARNPSNIVSEVQLHGKFLRQRATLSRPGASTTFPTFLGIAVLDKRPLADTQPKDGFDTGQILIDNKTGVLSVVNRWAYTRVGGEREYKINRISAPSEMDYWKAFFTYARGQARKFFLPTYRNDLVIQLVPSDSANSYTVQGATYAQRIFGVVNTHNYLEIETNGGIQRVTVTGATVVGNNSQISFTPAMPSGTPYTIVTRISYLQAVRLGSDIVTFRHFGYDTFLTLTMRGAE